ncbi:MAG: sugar transferase [Desulfomonilia bacterium]
MLGITSVFGFRIGFMRVFNRLGGVHSRKDFARLLDHERSRADRGGREFSLVVFVLPHIAKDQRAQRHFIRRLVNRVRQTELIGWVKTGETLGVILPDTPSHGAYKLVRDIFSLNGKPFTNRAFTVYTYPGSRLRSIHGPGRTQGESGQAGDDDSADTGEGPGEHSGPDPFSIHGLPFPIPGIPLWKRAFDIMGATAGLALLSPLFLSIALLIKAVSPGPVFFKQARVGFLGRHFTCWKFRTMEVEADSTVHRDHVRELYRNGQSLKKLDDEDPRIIPFGRVLRKTGLDEVPQLINILRGEMSLVGPRPDVPYSVEHYQPWYNRRFETYPGMTGLWQVNGKNSTTLDGMMRLDISYVKNRSPLLDVRIVLETIPALIRQATEKSSRRERPEQGRAMSLGRQVLQMCGVGAR